MKYYALIGDSSSTTYELDWQDLRPTVNELSTIVAEAYTGGYSQRYDIQLKNAKLMSISYHCLGGCKPMFKGGCKVFFPLWAKEEYVFNYIKNYMYFIKKFDLSKIPWKTPDPNKMAWGYYCQWIRSNAIRDTIAYLRNCDRQKELMETIREVAYSYQHSSRRIIGTEVTMSDLDGYSELFSEEYDLNPGHLDENYEEINEVPENGEAAT